MKLDETDKKILRHLLVDARQSARQLALRLDMATVTAISRIKKMEEAKIIRGYSARIDHEKMGYQLTAIIEITARDAEVLDMEADVAKFENVCAVYDITGAADTMIIAKFRGRGELSEFVKGLAEIPGIKNTVTHIVLDTTKEDFRLS